MAELVRCFIAIELPESISQELAVLVSALKKRSPDVVKWVDPGGIHLTLKFLGNVDSDRIDEITLAIEESVHGTPPFRLEVKDVGAFPNLDRGQVVWVGVTGELDKLAALQDRIERNTEQLGFPREERGFTPHLTLGRVRNYTLPEDRRKLGKILAVTTFAAAATLQVESVCLVKSQLTPRGAIYTPLCTTLLKAGG